jgi:Icc-related predicted phosphoesterase
MDLDLLKPIDYDENNERYDKIRIVVVSDTHEQHEMIQIPDGDILLHCGDFTNRHHWSNLSNNEIPRSIIDFNQWLGRLPHQYKIVICGNHEVGFKNLSKEEIQSKYLTNCIYLKDELIRIKGISIYGSPWSFDQSFRSKWSLIPSNIDILMTHIPPQYILDLAYVPNKPSNEPCSICNNSIHSFYEHWGSRSLAKEIFRRIHPRIHCFGHVHDHFGSKYDHRTLFINGAADLTKQTIQFYFYRDLKK